MSGPKQQTEMNDNRYIPSIWHSSTRPAQSRTRQ